MPTVGGTLRLTVNLGNYSSLSVELTYRDIDTNNLDSDLSAVRKAAPSVLSALDEDLGHALKSALGDGAVDEWRMQITNAVVKALQQQKPS
jgi:hypothetical protein